MTQEQTKKCIDLVERFMPKQVNTESLKEMAMYELYHTLKSAMQEAQAQPAPPEGKAGCPVAEAGELDWKAEYEEREKEINRLAREMDVAMFGEEVAAPQPRLCDVLKSVQQLAKAQPAPPVFSREPETLTAQQIAEVFALAAEMRAKNKWRFGQSLFNALYNINPKAADNIRGSVDYDPFYNDNNIAAFTRFLQSLNRKEP